MRLSRDEAREVAITALLLAVGVRVVAGLLQAGKEWSDGGTPRTILSQGLAPISITVGVLVLLAALLVVLSPRGSVGHGLQGWTAQVSAFVLFLGSVALLNGVIPGPGGILNRLPFALMQGGAAATLAGAAWWILINFDPDR